MNSIVREFHLAFGLVAPAYPPLRPDPDLVRLRTRLITEEYKEVIAELGTLARQKDPVKITENYQRLLKELADLRYVVEGAAVSLGLPIEAAYVEVHRSNMSKLGPDGRPVLRADGKVLKSANYTEADMDELVPAIIEYDPEEGT